MTDDELRAIVREAVRRRLGEIQPPSSAALSVARSHATDRAAHPSQAMYLTLVNAGEACLIEPSVGCTHCGYCRTHGH